MIIYLSERAPIEIVDDEWPVVMSNSQDDYGDGIAPTVTISVRKHDDGRCIVWATWPNGRGGYVLEHDGNVSHCISLLATESGIPSSYIFARECIQKLPAVNI